MSNTPELIDAQTVARILGVKTSTAYKIILSANDKLSKSGKIVVRGKVNRRYLYKLLDVSDIS